MATAIDQPLGVTESEAEALEAPFGTFEPEVVEFDGDIVNVYRQSPKPEWGDEAKEKLVIIIRDWDRSDPDHPDFKAGTDKAAVRVSRLSISINRRSMLARLARSLKESLGVELVAPKDLLHLTARWRIEDLGKGKYVSADVLSAVGKATRQVPPNILPYVPKPRTDVGVGEADGSEGPAVITAEATARFLQIVGPGGTAKEIGRRAMRDAEFRDKYPAAFSRAISGSLLDELVAAGTLNKSGEEYTAA